MASNDSDQPALFLPMATAERLDGSGVTFDGSEEAMRRLRHPFAVEQVRPTADRNPEQRD
ncbi:hypothetical protein [Micromonospora sp. LOL_024]|uniref:hypothetical protein n=1 Tax=Micromonospora sp. LOL_024 TaxID=3345412 RepID=UPI003A85F404